MGNICKPGHAMMRTALYEPANIVPSQKTRWSWLKSWGMHVARRRGMKRAKVRIAQPILVKRYSPSISIFTHFCTSISNSRFSCSIFFKAS